MWVEIRFPRLWHCNVRGHPLREDVSWNAHIDECFFVRHTVILFVRMWVEIWKPVAQAEHSLVILFVRMWVEILCTLWHFPCSWSSSSWGCELKCGVVCGRFASIVILFVRMWVEMYMQRLRQSQERRHPLREDVSWNAYYNQIVWSMVVILFVRMWVEIYIIEALLHLLYVILFVRMWVEIIFSSLLDVSNPSSSSSWGCELKF